MTQYPTDTWVNADGLRVKFGTSEAVPARVAEYHTDGPTRFTEIMLDSSWLPAFGNTYLIDSYVFPKNAEITGYEVGPTETDFAGTGATLTINLVDLDGTSDVVALASTLSLTNLNTPSFNTDKDITLTKMKFIQLSVGTASYTDGSGKIRIRWESPKKESDTLAWSKS